MSPRHSQVAAASTAQQSASAAALPLLEAQTFLTEGIEHLIRWHDVDHNQVDALLGDAMRRIAKARSAVLELKRAKDGHPTIASVG